MALGTCSVGVAVLLFPATKTPPAILCSNFSPGQKKKRNCPCLPLHVSPTLKYYRKKNCVNTSGISVWELIKICGYIFKIVLILVPAICFTLGLQKDHCITIILIVKHKWMQWDGFWEVWSILTSKATECSHCWVFLKVLASEFCK